MSEPANYQLLRDIARKQMQLAGVPITYLEIGVNEGGSALAVLGTGAIERATLIDNWCYGSSRDGVEAKLKDFADKVEIITGNSTDVLPRLEDEFDLIFVDGDHTAEGAQFDMQQALRLLHTDGTMVVDDLDHQEFPFLRELVMNFAKDHNMSLIIHPVHTTVGELTRL